MHSEARYRGIVSLKIICFKSLSYVFASLLWIQWTCKVFTANNIEYKSKNTSKTATHRHLRRVLHADTITLRLIASLHHIGVSVTGAITFIPCSYKCLWLWGVSTYTLQMLKCVSVIAQFLFRFAMFLLYKHNAQHACIQYWTDFKRP